MAGACSKAVSGRKSTHGFQTMTHGLHIDLVCLCFYNNMFRVLDEPIGFSFNVLHEPSHGHDQSNFCQPDAKLAAARNDLVRLWRSPVNNVHENEF